jgi:hypothetical protein
VVSTNGDDLVRNVRPSALTVLASLTQSGRRLRIEE